MKLFLLSMTMGVCMTAHAQYTERFQEEFFFGHLNNAATESMGRADVAVGGKVFSMRFNPAGTGTIEQRELALSTSAPFYILTQSDYYYGGFAEKIGSKLCVSGSVQQFAVGPTTFTTDIGSERNLALDNPTSTKISVNGSYEVIEGLYVGVNVNQFRLKFFDEVGAYSSLYFDGGLLYRRSLNEDKKRYVQAGASLMNLNNATMTLESPTGQESDVNLPSIMRIGLAFHQKTPLTIKGAKPGSLELTCTVELEDVRQFDYRTMRKVGVEATLYDLLSVRCGHVAWNQNDFGFATNYSKISDFTYGFGVQIPSNTTNSLNLPFNVFVDFTSMKQPPYSDRGRRIPNMRSFSTRLVWNLTKGGSNE